MDVKFLRGTSANYKALTVKDNKTFYFLTDTNELYLGEILLSWNENELEKLLFTELGLLASETISTISEANGVISVTKQEIAITTDQVRGFADKVRTLIPDITIVDNDSGEFITGLSANDHTITITRGDAAEVTIPPIVINDTTTGASATTDEVDVVTDFTAENHTITVTRAKVASKKYVDEQVEGLEFKLSEDGKTLELLNKDGETVATLDTNKFVVDGMISAVELNDEHDLVLTFNTDAEDKVITVPLDELIDVYTAGDGIEINGNVVSHKDTSNIVDLEAIDRTYVTGLTFDKFGHVTGYEIGRESIVDTNTAELRYNEATHAVVADVDDTSAVIPIATASKLGLMKGGYTSSGKDYAVQLDSTGAAHVNVPWTDTTYTFADGSEGQFTVTPAGGSAQTVNTGAKDYTDTVIGKAANTTGGPSGIYAAIQGNTSDTVEGCVNAINNINTQLTWGSF